MKKLKWSPLKSSRLKKVRGVSFEEIVRAQFITIRDHPKRDGQYIVCFYHKSYVWAVPCIEEEGYIFLKTLYPSRKYTRMYERGELV